MEIINSTRESGAPILTDMQDHSQRDRVKAYIDGTLTKILDELQTPEGRPSLTLRRRSAGSSFFINRDSLALEKHEVESASIYSWPGRNAHEAWKFTVIIRVLAAITEALHADLVVSKRDIYYNDPACFGSQSVVNAIVDDIAHTIGVDRLAMNVEAAAKGLTAGHYCLTTKAGEAIDFRLSTKDTLIPRSEDIHQFDISEVKWVLILEKEAVYRRLSRSSYHDKSLAGKGILVTGKGYPDLSTRAFVRRLFDETKSLPPEEAPRFYGLVDGDPDGMAIMSTYKYGSMAHAHDNGKLNVPGLRWMGLRMSDLIASTDPAGDSTLMRLTARDRKKAIAMLSNNPALAMDGPEPEWRAELQQMLMLNLKAELEILYDQEEGINGWIDKRMATLS